MTATTGDRIPDVPLVALGPEGRLATTSREFFAGRKVALFAVPGAFTSTCSEVHLPGFVVRSEDLAEAGIEAIACTAVNDAAVMAAWGESTGATPYMTLLADGNGDLARALGLELDGTAFGLGFRSRRYAAVVSDGVIDYLGVESGPGVGVSSADAVLAFLAGEGG